MIGIEYGVAALAGVNVWNAWCLYRQGEHRDMWAISVFAVLLLVAAAGIHQL